MNSVSSARLRRLPAAIATGAPIIALDAADVLIGRDPQCQIVFDSQLFGGISRQHAKVCAIEFGWQICDLNSANGTFVNGQRVSGCRLLQNGDRIALGLGEPQFIFEQPQSASIASAASSIASPDQVTLSQLLPIVSTGRDLTRKAFLIPAMLNVAFVVLLFVAIGRPTAFNLLLAAYLAGAAFYFVYQLCGKHKPWWLLLGVAASMMLILLSPILTVFGFVFRQLLPGAIPAPDEFIPFPVLLVRMFFGAGLMEELLKAIPVLVLCGVTPILPRRWKSIEVSEPLDGILLGAAAAVGFALIETLRQYVPAIAQESSLPIQSGELLGLQLLIPRILGLVAGHMAYSGYFGYFIGLSVLKPNHRWRILGVGYLSAASLHALWNATGVFNIVVLAIVGVLSYAFLAAAILKARALSPNRPSNFATRFTRLP
ncbi:PrsW family intramembrane metalloprotease [Microcoleus sp. FACHB-1515]|uniref:PrsW family glutamic-type intramembrane protease n=1 Tax=Cyanophyceae TaxID=3028117 RepID=UPI001683FBAE|nr:PrsW family glutamic-type intramembrane protease [Microcoleus sp. FACHB-1515]MBD2092175.1 PrsW family intramembrane metalloprotease [Microcoleus sp. FACHB-1515]